MMGFAEKNGRFSNEPLIQPMSKCDLQTAPLILRHPSHATRQEFP